MANVPHDLVAEESVLGAMLLSDQAIDAIAESLVAGDFYKPAHALMYDTMLKLREHGTSVDAVSVYNAIQGQGLLDTLGDPSQFVSLQTNVPSVANARHYAWIVMDASLRRRMYAEALGLAERACDMTVVSEDALEAHQAVMAGLGLSVIDREPDDVSVEEYLKQPREEMSPWAIHGVIRKRHKIMLVGDEGGGKSWIGRYVAICAAYGIQPFRHTLLKRPVRTLIVDLENPEDALTESFEKILRQASSFNPQSETVNRFWHRPAGINLRNRVDIAELENVIRVRQPEFVFLGPLYASYENSGKDFGWETAAKEVQRALKQLMVRYNFGMLIEDHAPQADNRGNRQMRPYGSSFWRRWPEIGIGMEPIGESGEAFRLTRWRGDRVAVDWPLFIERGSVTGSRWPFESRWA